MVGLDMGDGRSVVEGQGQLLGINASGTSFKSVLH